MLRLGLTGGIGSGKSTVAQFLVGQGAALVDADAISRAVTATGGSAIAQIAQMFGREALTAHGAMNRDVMRQRAFEDPNIKRQLEGIIHPLVGAESARQAQVALQAGRALVVFDVPLLVESQTWRQKLGKVLVVDCEKATQISRVKARDGAKNAWTQEAIERAISTQASRAQRLAAADLVIFNDGLTLAELAEQVRQVYGRLTL